MDIFNKYFSWLGTQNNPPNMMLKKGDAIEEKKIETANTSLALNSSYPKNILLSSNPMITEACRECEEWGQKDLIYTIGQVKDANLKSLWMVYGDYMLLVKMYITE